MAPRRSVWYMDLTPDLGEVVDIAAQIPSWPCLEFEVGNAGLVGLCLLFGLTITGSFRALAAPVCTLAASFTLARNICAFSSRGAVKARSVRATGSGLAAWSALASAVLALHAALALGIRHVELSSRHEAEQEEKTQVSTI